MKFYFDKGFVRDLTDLRPFHHSRSFGCREDEKANAYEEIDCSGGICQCNQEFPYSRLLPQAHLSPSIHQPLSPVSSPSHTDDSARPKVAADQPVSPSPKSKVDNKKSSPSSNLLLPQPESEYDVLKLQPDAD